jgi:signal transduction histidine kinase
MTLMTASQCAAWSLYGSAISAYLEWWGGIGCVSLALVFLIQFAYTFPRSRYKREAHAALYLSLLISGGLFALMAFETWNAQGHRVYATAPGTLDAAFAPGATWFTYNFERFSFGFTAARHTEVLTSFRLFDLWQIIGNLWVLSVWLRKTLQFSSASDLPPLRRLWMALRYPQSKEARLSRAWALMMLLAPLPVLTSMLDGAGILPPGTFAMTHLFVLFGILLTYMNSSPEPTTFMAKLVGISLLTLLALLGVVSSAAMRAHRNAYTQQRRAELQHIAALLDTERFDSLPADVLYVAARPLQGLFATDYRIVVGRPGAPDAAILMTHDALLREGLERDSYPPRCVVLYENPWLGLQGIQSLEDAPVASDAHLIPTETLFYRGSSSLPRARFVRYSFTQNKVRYEVGYSYLDYRRSLHRAALPLAVLMSGATVSVLVLFPYFFHTSLVAPLMHLLSSLQRVDRGERHVQVPVRAEDEIGEMTHAFNRMVASLRSTEARLRALNLTLEQRVADRTRDLATLYEVAALINEDGPLSELLAAALANIVPAVDGAAGAIVLADGEGRTLSLAASHRLPSALGDALEKGALVRKIYERGELLLVHDVAADDSLASLLPPLSYATFAGVPISGRDGVVGALVLFGDSAYLFNVEDLRQLGSLAEQLGVAIENARLRKRAAVALVIEERQRLARDLHDSVTQLLYSQTLFAEGAALSLREGQLERAQHCVSRLGETTYRALREMRLMIYRLRPADLADLGLEDALQQRLERVEQRAGIRASLTVGEDIPLSPKQESALYRMAEEALNNALKHAGATEVQVALTCRNQNLLLAVTDNGCGFDSAQIAPGFGLQGLRERAAELGGTLIVKTHPGGGTRVVARVPLVIEEGAEQTMQEKL